MSMDRKTAVIFGGSGAIGTNVGHALARQGAHVHLGARSTERLMRAAAAIRAEGGEVDMFEVDALDARATSERVAEIAGRTDGIDIVINATSFMHDQAICSAHRYPTKFLLRRKAGGNWFFPRARCTSSSASRRRP